MPRTFAKHALVAFSLLAGGSVAAAAGCSSGTALVGDGEGGVGTDGSTPPPGDGATIPPVNPNCPTAVPPDGTSCKPVASCTYQSGPHGSCTVTANCVSTSVSGPFLWSVSKPG